jgi:hypothetical protein
VVVKEVLDDEVVSLLINFNKQRIKTTRELINEHSSAKKVYIKGQGRRTDLEISATNNRSETTRDVIAEKLGVSFSQMARLLYIQKTDLEFMAQIANGAPTAKQAHFALRKRKADLSNVENGSKKSLVGDASFTFYQNSSHQIGRPNRTYYKNLSTHVT